jgi:hypothetical protein
MELLSAFTVLLGLQRRILLFFSFAYNFFIHPDISTTLTGDDRYAILLEQAFSFPRSSTLHADLATFKSVINVISYWCSFKRCERDAKPVIKIVFLFFLNR